jgi:hypothetical protein
MNVPYIAVQGQKVKQRKEIVEDKSNKAKRKEAVK